VASAAAERPAFEHAQAGGVYVYESSGASPLADSSFFSQATPGVGGDPKAYAQFSKALATGDFDGDGHFDLAIGSPFFGINGNSNAGLVNVLYGGAAGLSATGSIHLRQGNGLKGVAEADDLLGRSLVAGRFRSGPYWDLVIGVPGEDVAGVNSAGAIHMLRGGANGVTTVGQALLHGGSSASLTSADLSDRFSRSLAAR
jgi:hypothetical protein